jgi:hypothetical protein
MIKEDGDEIQTAVRLRSNLKNMMCTIDAHETIMVYSMSKFTAYGGYGREAQLHVWNSMRYIQFTHHIDAPLVLWLFKSQL